MTEHLVLNEYLALTIILGIFFGFLYLAYNTYKTSVIKD